MITKVDSIILTCDKCEDVYTNSNDFSIFADTQAAIQDATDDEWTTVDDKHFCPNCQ